MWWTSGSGTRKRTGREIFNTYVTGVKLQRCESTCSLKETNAASERCCALRTALRKRVCSSSVRPDSPKLAGGFGEQTGGNRELLGLSRAASFFREVAPLGLIDLVAAARRALRVGTALVRLINDHEVPTLLPDALPHIILFGVIE
jgi:hypothetical protein